MNGEKQGGQNQDNFWEYDTNTLAEIYATVPEGLAGFSLGLAGLVNALIDGGEHKILKAKVEPLDMWKPENTDPREKFNLYYASGGWLGTKTEYTWEPVTLREKKEEKPTTPQLHPYEPPYGYPYEPPYGYPYRPYSQTSTNQSQSGGGITVPNLPNTDDFENMWKNIKSYIGG